MGDRGNAGRAILTWATIVSLTVCVVGLGLVRYAGPPALQEEASQHMLTRLATRLRGHIHENHVDPEARTLLEAYAVSARLLLLLATDYSNRVVLSMPPVPFLLGKEVNSQRGSPEYGHVIQASGGEDESESLERFYPRGHAIVMATVKTEKGVVAGHLWGSRPRAPALVPYAWLAIAGGVSYWLLLPWWVLLDARLRRARALPFAILTLVTNAAGWAAYMVVRPEYPERCTACGQALTPGFRICPSCGQPVGGKCPRCGAPLRQEWRFCPYCEHTLPEPPGGENGGAASDDVTAPSMPGSRRPP